VYVGDVPRSDAAQLVRDDVAVAVLQAYQPAVLQLYMPYAVAGDGNCCYRAVSLALYGTEAHHLHVRTLAAIEMLSHRANYDISDAAYVGTLDVLEMFVDTYSRLLDAVPTSQCAITC